MKKKLLPWGFSKYLAASIIFAPWFCHDAFCQSRDSVKTGYLPDAAEEYWPAHKSTDPPQDFFSHIGHLPIRHNKGFISIGGSLREGYDRFSNYLWGIGPQDDNGYFLHRVLLHTDFRYNKHVRFFGEIESSSLSGRNGGPRPIQDLNKLAFTQLFAEYTARTPNNTILKLRVGEQALHYGVGSLLDIRDANVHRSFAGAKFIMVKGDSKLDVFAMELMKTNPGFFDDQIDASQKIVGAWFTQNFQQGWLNKADVFYIHTNRQNAVFTQGAGTDKRHTIGTGLTFAKKGWSAYTEADLQLGTFGSGSILAWKVTQTITHQFTGRIKPDVSLQSAMSSGDKNAADPDLQTFNPIYPKAIYYGFIDNAGASNLFLIHLKSGIQPFTKIHITGGYYRLWRQSTGDGIYNPGGISFIPASNSKRSIGQMYDLVTAYQHSNRLSITGIATYYKRGAFLKAVPAAGHDIWYTGISANLHF
ncbi:alginate export family protein [Mucilaginibacter endophyticus]|uniref:alginate export family protein n=1 Tax=Mucilaginibacter endophyticus TaxID=2675003 RepID=UPI000E0D91BF|nr:alginate export family protein [Mucilaginibacter endophyticus]